MTGKRIGIKAEYSGKVYSLARIEKPKAKGYVKVKEDKRTVLKRKVASHPWKSDYPGNFRYDSRDGKLTEGLYDSTIAWETESY